MCKTIVTCAVVSAVALLGASVQPTFAQTETQSVVVNYADLDIRSDAGAASMLARLRAAAAAVCAPWNQGQKGVDSHLRFVACRDTALSQSVASLDAPRVTALYAGHAPTQLAQASGSH
jgi:UrcA family protein